MPFRDCRHAGEPGCAVAAAVERGDADGDRAARWRKLVTGDEENSEEVAEGRRIQARKDATGRGGVGRRAGGARGGCLGFGRRLQRPW